MPPEVRLTFDLPRAGRLRTVSILGTIPQP